MGRTVALLVLSGVALCCTIALCLMIRTPAAGSITPHRDVTGAVEAVASPQSSALEGVQGEATPPPAPCRIPVSVEPTPRPAERLEDRIKHFGGVGARWTLPGLWAVEGDCLVHRATPRLDEPADYDVPLTGPCEVSLEVQLIGRRKEDARGFWIKSGDHEVHVRLDNSPDEFELKVLPERHAEATTYPLDEQRWFRLRCQIERGGRVCAFLDDHNMLEWTWQGTFPARLGLECQRSGGRFRRIAVRYL